MLVHICWRKWCLCKPLWEGVVFFITNVGRQTIHQMLHTHSDAIYKCRANKFPPLLQSVLVQVTQAGVVFNFLFAVKVHISVEVRCTDVSCVSVGVIYSHVVPLVVIHLLNSEIRCHQYLLIYTEAQASPTILVLSNSLPDGNESKPW